MKPIQGYSLSPIAATGDRFSDFSPYVPSINADGIVAFQAALTGGGSAVFASDGAAVEPVAVAPGGPVLEFRSHPAINRTRTIAVYGSTPAGANTLLIGGPGRMELPEDCAGRFDSAGPLGPTINEAGAVGFRATLADGDFGVFARRDGVVELVASTAGNFSMFHGLPLINHDGGVIFRAGLKTGEHGIFHARAGRATSLVETGDEFLELGSFPAVNDRGTLAFAGISRKDGPGVFTLEGGKPALVFGATRHFESFRGALVSDVGDFVFYATPAAGRRGIYFGPDPSAHKLLGIGSEIHGATVADFALNPVSINAAGQLAIRIALADGGQVILRGDPVR